MHNLIWDTIRKFLRVRTKLSKIKLTLSINQIKNNGSKGKDYGKKKEWEFKRFKQYTKEVR